MLQLQYNILREALTCTECIPSNHLTCKVSHKNMIAAINVHNEDKQIECSMLSSPLTPPPPQT